MPNLNRILRDSFENERSIIPFELNRQLQDLFPKKQILYTQDSDFELDEFAREGRCVIWEMDALDPLVAAWWRGRASRTFLKPMHALVEVVWKSHRLACLTVRERCIQHSFILADSIHAATDF